MLSSFEQKKSDPLYQEIQIVIKVPEINENSIPNSIINNFDEKLNYKNRSDLHFETKTLPESGAIENFESVVEHAPSLVESNVVSINKDILGPDNMPTILDDTIRGARFLKSIDREVKVIEKVFAELGIDKSNAVSIP